MTEYEHDDPHAEIHHDIPDLDLPDHSQHDAPPAPPVDHFGPADAELPAELRFPGEDTDAQAVPPAELDPTAPWPDDDEFSRWLTSTDSGAADDPDADSEMRDGMAAPAQASELPDSDALVDWTLRQLDES